MLKILDLYKGYSNRTIFNGLSFTIPKQSIVSLTGINGIGKTTLLNILGGTTTFTGSISLSDTDINKNFKGYMEKTSLIPNSPFLYDYLTVSEMIELVSSLSKYNNDDIIEELFDKLNLEGFETVFIKNLSLGTKQKVAFIIGFINNPELILIDEPFVNFDRASLKNLLSFLCTYVNKTNSIIIFSTHSIDQDIQDIVSHNLHIVSKDQIDFSRMD
ncbi:ABC transporter ATP-binding protein [Bacillus gobiensis]|uniref:ATP-binding cassette domain-containing protein n=1 Tax=Bacillus gobiensis TaxID=1441095 RepID=UPI003D250684